MQRRTLLKHLATALGFTAVGGLAGCVGNGPAAASHHRRDESDPAARARLFPFAHPADEPLLAALADERFREALPRRSADELLAGLEQVGIFFRGRINLGKLAEDAESHLIIEFAGFPYTEPELMLYALVARFHSNAPFPACRWASFARRRVCDG